LFTPDAPHNVKYYLDHLRNLKNSAPQSLPDLVIISGDLTSFAAEDEMNGASDAIKQIVDTLKVKTAPWRGDNRPPYVLIVPGNHDLDWREETYERKIDRYARMASNLAQDGSVLSAVYQDDRGDVYCDFGENCNIFVYLFNTIPLGGVRDPRIERIHKALSELYSKFGDQTEAIPERLEELHSLSRQDPGYIDAGDFLKLSQAVQNAPKSRFKIAVMHHNPTSVPSDDVEAYDSMINAGLVKRALTQNGFDLLLHGHRHLSHSSHERLIRWNTAAPQGFFVVAADSLGCKSHAPFVEIVLRDPTNAHGNKPPSSILRATEWTYEGEYSRAERPIVEEPLHHSMYASFVEIMKYIGRTAPVSSKESLFRAFDTLTPDFEVLRSQILDYDDRTWSDDFNDRLDDYAYLFATDIQVRSSIDSPLFGQYMRDQFTMRARKVRQRSDHRLFYSPLVYDAVIRTGWRPDETLWKGYELARATPDDGSDLEIVRVLLRNPFLQTVPQYLGKGIMISDPNKRKKFAENYDKIRKPSKLITNKLETHFGPMERHSRGIDLGCGTGNYTLTMRRIFEEVIGLDLSDEMLDIANAKDVAHEVSWVRGNALCTSLEGENYDGIWAISVLHYFNLEQQRVFFNEIFRLLRRGGRAVVDATFEEQHRSLWIVEFFPSLKERYEGRLLSCEQYKALLQEIGFKIKIERLELSEDDPDPGIRLGHRHPERYLNERALAAIPAFSEMPSHERRTGRYSLEQAIVDRRIRDIIARYAQGSDQGDFALIIAEK
jgi:ubiquinone/menaquinone biosynthesis C-methylase UbiE